MIYSSRIVPVIVAFGYGCMNYVYGEMWRGLLGDWLLGGALVLGVLWLPAFINARSYSRRLKPIYDRWVHQHGTDPDKWPDASKPE